MFRHDTTIEIIGVLVYDVVLLLIMVIVLQVLVVGFYIPRTTNTAQAACLHHIFSILFSMSRSCNSSNFTLVFSNTASHAKDGALK